MTPDPNEDSSNKLEFPEDVSGGSCALELGSFTQDQDEDYFETRSQFSESPSELKSEVFESISDTESVSSETAEDPRKELIYHSQEQSENNSTDSNITCFSKVKEYSQIDLTELYPGSFTQLNFTEPCLTSEHKGKDIKGQHEKDKENTIKTGASNLDPKSRDGTTINDVEVNGSQRQLINDKEIFISPTSWTTRGWKSVKLNCTNLKSKSEDCLYSADSKPHKSTCETKSHENLSDTNFHSTNSTNINPYNQAETLQIQCKHVMSEHLLEGTIKKSLGKDGLNLDVPSAEFKNEVFIRNRHFETKEHNSDNGHHPEDSTNNDNHQLNLIRHKTSASVIDASHRTVDKETNSSNDIKPQSDANSQDRAVIILTQSVHATQSNKFSENKQKKTSESELSKIKN
ncbi:uncharacterized protein O3C94_004855, partial [Discoglossus pictus]